MNLRKHLLYPLCFYVFNTEKNAYKIEIRLLILNKSNNEVQNSYWLRIAQEGDIPYIFLRDFRNI